MHVRMYMHVYNLSIYLSKTSECADYMPEDLT